MIQSDVRWEKQKNACKVWRKVKWNIYHTNGWHHRRRRHHHHKKHMKRMALFWCYAVYSHTVFNFIFLFFLSLCLFVFLPFCASIHTFGELTQSLTKCSILFLFICIYKLFFFRLFSLERTNEKIGGNVKK